MLCHLLEQNAREVPGLLMRAVGPDQERNDDCEVSAEDSSADKIAVHTATIDLV
jgi:hypothetical protein